MCQKHTGPQAAGPPNLGVIPAYFCWQGLQPEYAVSAGCILIEPRASQHVRLLLPALPSHLRQACLQQCSSSMSPNELSSTMGGMVVVCMVTQPHTDVSAL